MKEATQFRLHIHKNLIFLKMKEATHFGLFQKENKGKKEQRNT